ncbi:MAG: hypothetical protein JW991_03260 [Candidatus Pacebacteria bacterium]|nr:hypothetical protein [Candidatus Paceibacterota bacterium]
MDLADFKSKARLADSFFEELSARLDFRSLVVLLLVALVVPISLMVALCRNNLSVDEAIIKAKLLTTSGKPAQATRLLMSLRKKNLTEQSEKKLILALMENNRLDQGQVAGASAKPTVTPKVSERGSDFTSDLEAWLTE